MKNAERLQDAIGMIDGEFIVNPTLEQRRASDMHLVVSGTKEAIMMVEAGANEVPENIMLDANRNCTCNSIAIFF